MILILGVTASGKSALAFELARKLNGQIISIDSMKVYRRMDIGTAKPAPAYREQVPYHLIDVVEPSESFSVDQFLTLAEGAIDHIRTAQKTVVAVGGTAMYIKTLLYGLFDGPGQDKSIRERLKKQIAAEGSASLHRRLTEIDPQAALRIHPNDARRIIRALEIHELTGKPISSFQQQFNAENTLDDWTVIGLRREKDVESRRINARVKRMIESGIADEVRSLLAEPEPLSKQARAAIGYAEMIDHLKGKMNMQDTVEKIKVNTRRLAKGQRTWFKTFQNVNWLDIAPDEPAEGILSQTIQIIEADK